MIFIKYFTMLIYGVFFTPQTFFIKKLNFNNKNDKICTHSPFNRFSHPFFFTIFVG